MNKKLMEALNDQFNFELLSGYHYLAMAAYCEDENMKGFTNFFIKQAHEEYEHAMKFFDFIYDMDGRVYTQAFPEPKNEFKSFLEVFEAALHHEEEVTKRIHKILDLAKEENHYPTQKFLQWFVEEQVEEETTMKDYIFKLENIKDSFTGLMLLDRELAQRQ